MRTLALILLLMSCNNGYADLACRDLILSVQTPVFPAAPAAGAALARYGACSIKLRYEIALGHAINVKAISAEKRCEIFERSAIKAMQSFEFKSLPIQLVCTHEFIFDIE